MGAVVLHDQGVGPAVLLLHGSPSSAACFAPLVDALAPRHRVLVADLPGYGESPPLDAPRGDLERVRALLEDALVARGISELAVVGYSLGSYRAIQLAVSARVRVTHLVCLAGLSGLDPEGRSEFRRAAAMLRDGFDFRPIWLARMTAPGFAETHEREAAEVMAWLDCAPRDVIIGEIEAIAEAPDLSAALGVLDVPILARVGALDAAAPVRFSERLARASRRATLEVVPGVGHALLYEDGEATVASVVRALG
jgi:pimeloyl-ACP methyl ester carboxylesterase